ncbi:hypothetical protein BESB_044040 [Besnoitia besnoiti]|uniref:Uncharacterized protein n=1 Tax=Besnoitia besnoiti TaxID=94643 RepID=A0A2A9ML94_BESBE|nr:hypothetical protein BESB_044040 [Besnoitia besnoiti]PFH36212.1 hypothetical protein BESB_044040 [Besnoitia besnoiti]
MEAENVKAAKGDRPTSLEPGALRPTAQTCHSTGVVLFLLARDSSGTLKDLDCPRSTPRKVPLTADGPWLHNCMSHCCHWSGEAVQILQRQSIKGLTRACQTRKTLHNLLRLAGSPYVDPESFQKMKAFFRLVLILGLLAVATRAVAQDAEEVELKNEGDEGSDPLDVAPESEDADDGEDHADDPQEEGENEDDGDDGEDHADDPQEEGENEDDGDDGDSAEKEDSQDDDKEEYKEDDKDAADEDKEDDKDTADEDKEDDTDADEGKEDDEEADEDDSQEGDKDDQDDSRPLLGVPIIECDCETNRLRTTGAPCSCEGLFREAVHSSLEPSQGLHGVVLGQHPASGLFRQSVSGRQRLLGIGIGFGRGYGSGWGYPGYGYPGYGYGYGYPGYGYGYPGYGWGGYGPGVGFGIYF